MSMVAHHTVQCHVRPFIPGTIVQFSADEFRTTPVIGGNEGARIFYPREDGITPSSAQVWFDELNPFGYELMHSCFPQRQESSTSLTHSGSSMKSASSFQVAKASWRIGPISAGSRIYPASKQSHANIVHCGTESKILCSFESLGSSTAGGLVIVSSAPPKLIGRMREKLVEYNSEGAEWPLTACILDPVRSSIVCDGPAQIMEIIGWILEAAADGSGMPVCKIKNKFSLTKEQLV